MTSASRSPPIISPPPPGQIKSDYTQTSINALTSLDSAKAFGQLVVKQTRRHADPARQYLDDRARPGIGRFVLRLRWAEGRLHRHLSDADGQSARCHHQCAQGLSRSCRASCRSGLHASIAYDATAFIRASIQEVAKTLGEAALIVIVVIFLFLGNLRSTIIPIVTIPLSLIGVMSLLLALGYSLNLLTLLAFVLAIGLVVDDAIVVVENIYRHMEEGLIAPPTRR